jgi:hypothetical protein
LFERSLQPVFLPGLPDRVERADFLKPLRRCRRSILKWEKEEKPLSG